MRIGGRRTGAAVAGLLLVVVLVLAGIAFVRWRAAGEAHAIVPPAGAAAPSFEGAGYEKAVADRAAIIERSMSSDRGDATVRIYAMPDRSPWLQARKLVATQLDHWEQDGDCADRPTAAILECGWREPTSWWPREVFLTMVRLPATTEDGGRRPVTTFVIIGSGVAG